MYEYNTLQNNSYAGLFYRYRMFNGFNTENQPSYFSPKNARMSHAPIGDDENTYVNSAKSYELFQTYELRYNHNIKNKYNVLVIVPYLINQNYFGEVIPLIGSPFDSLHTNKGIGDIILSGERVFRVKKNEKIHTLKIGSAFSLPTGKFELVNNKGFVTDPSHQTGTGVINILPRIQYQLIYSQRFGLTTGLSSGFNIRKKNSKIANGIATTYHFGNRINANLTVFSIVGKYTSFKCIPKIGLYYEYVFKDELNQLEQEDTGGNVTFLSIGNDFMYKDFQLQLMYQAPISENLNGEQLKNAGRVIIGLIYNFNRDKKEEKILPTTD